MIDLLKKVKLGVGLGLLEMAKFANDVRVRPREIVTYPDERLRTPCEEVTDFSKEGTRHLCKVAHIMVRTLAAQKKGARLGLAANQCGFDIRVAIVMGRFVVNPIWTPTKATPLTKMTEGCYSLPGETFNVMRSTTGWAKYQDVDGEWIEEKLNGLKAVVYQHELAHLNGLTCKDEAVQ